MADVNQPKPSFFDRALAAIAPSIALQRAVAREKLTYFGFDAANPGAKRGSSGGMTKNASSDTARMGMDRLKLIWEARDLERNMPVIRCVLDRITQYVVSQLLYQSQTGDAEWDSAAEAYFQNWMDNDADVTGRRNFRMLVELGFRSALRDGDFGFYLIRNGPKLQVQCIEADRIGDPNKVGSSQEENYVQGIHLNPLGQPVGSSRVDLQACKLEYSIVSPK